MEDVDLEEEGCIRLQTNVSVFICEDFFNFRVPQTAYLRNLHRKCIVQSHPTESESEEQLTKDSIWRVCPALTQREGAISLMALDDPHYYLRHRCGLCELGRSDGTDLFKHDATWIFQFEA